DEAQPVHTREYKARLAPGAAWELPQGGIPELATNFEGSAVVSADQPVAVVVNHSNRRSLLATVGQTTGAATLNAPLVMTNNGGFSSVVHVENVGETVTNVTITVVDSTTGAVVGTETRTLTPATTTKWGPLPGTERAGNAPFVGSATITASTGGLLVGAVEQYNPGTNQSSEYTLFAGGSADVVAPLVQTGNSGWSSGFQVMNVGTTPATVTVRVTSTEGLAVESVPNPTRTIAPGRSETWFPITAPDVRVVGSAVAEGSAGSQLVGVVNQLNTTATTADLFMTYEALNR
ncbi:MAG: hypothetical protein HY329_12805, partial [Chloroflexi bacterium]|nr:hypothetical protein [Chloroflexota bacterium]